MVLRPKYTFVLIRNPSSHLSKKLLETEITKKILASVFAKYMIPSGLTYKGVLNLCFVSDSRLPKNICFD